MTFKHSVARLLLHFYIVYVYCVVIVSTNKLRVSAIFNIWSRVMIMLLFHAGAIRTGCSVEGASCARGLHILDNTCWTPDTEQYMFYKLK